MPGFLYVSAERDVKTAHCREHGLIGKVGADVADKFLNDVINDHANELHPWWFDPTDDSFGGPAFVAQRRVRCDHHPTLLLSEAFGRYDEAATAARKHNEEQHAEVAAASPA